MVAQLRRVRIARANGQRVLGECVEVAVQIVVRNRVRCLGNLIWTGPGGAVLQAAATNSAETARTLGRMRRL
jgi:hypothetical protein